MVIVVPLAVVAATPISSCADLFSSVLRGGKPKSPAAVIGVSAACAWGLPSAAGATTLRIGFAMGSWALPDDVFEFAPGAIQLVHKGRATTFTHVYPRALTVAVGAPDRVVLPTALLSAPNKIGNCDALRLSSAASSGGGPMPLLTQWWWDGLDVNVSKVLGAARDSTRVVLQFGAGVPRDMSYRFTVGVTNAVTRLQSNSSATVFISVRSPQLRDHHDYPSFIVLTRVLGLRSYMFRFLYVKRTSILAYFALEIKGWRVLTVVRGPSTRASTCPPSSSTARRCWQSGAPWRSCC